jgi:hypothetical protein
MFIPDLATLLGNIVLLITWIMFKCSMTISTCILFFSHFFHLIINFLFVFVHCITRVIPRRTFALNRFEENQITVMIFILVIRLAFSCKNEKNRYTDNDTKTRSSQYNIYRYLLPYCSQKLQNFAENSSWYKSFLETNKLLYPLHYEVFYETLSMAVRKRAL